jgi:hypothetical protein
MTDDTSDTDYHIDRLGDLSRQAAESGDEDVFRSFFQALTSAQLIVPERNQDHPSKNQPRYPDPFLNILGVQQDERVLVPCFSSESALREWSGHSIRTRSLSINDLINLLPEGWWLVLNPGGEGEKELSPWEIDTIKGGEQNIDSLVQELMLEAPVRDLTWTEIDIQKYSGLKNVVVEIAQTLPEVRALYGAVENGTMLNDSAHSALVLGVLVLSVPPKRREEIHDTFSRIVSQTQIGDTEVKIRVGDSIQGNLLLGIFEGMKPFYEMSLKTGGGFGFWRARIGKFIRGEKR